jgi:F0F1-type ATP synthase epsilon subunit
MSKANPETLFITARSPESMVFQGVCSAVSASNNLGPFDILPGHQNFITNINGDVVIHFLDSDETHIIPVQMGILRVKLNSIDLFIILTPKEAAAVGEAPTVVPADVPKAAEKK